MNQPTPRLLPSLDTDNKSFWTGGERGELLIQRCLACGHYIHPPVPVCPKCLGRDVEAAPVSGKALIASYTLNHQQWVPNLEIPYVIAIVELAEQQGLRLTTNIINCPPDNVYIGMPVSVVFEKQEEIFLPLFEPREQRDEDGAPYPGPS